MTTHLRHGAGPRMVLALLAALCGIIGATALGTTPAAAADQRHAIYAIAHRVDTLDGVDAALKHGANGIEIWIVPYRLACDQNSGDSARPVGVGEPACPRWSGGDSRVGNGPGPPVPRTRT
ncbi:hypothetical protein ABZ769_23650 [Streptomyces olivoreticuli]